MELELLPKDSHLVDYRTYESDVIYRQYLLDGSVYHFTLHPELYPQANELLFTGRYLAVVTSVRGLETFYISPDDEGNFAVDYDDDEPGHDMQVENDMQQMLKEVNIETIDSDEDDTINSYQDKDENDRSEGEIDGMDWLKFDPEESLLPLMVTAIQEYGAAS